MSDKVLAKSHVLDVNPDHLKKLVSEDLQAVNDLIIEKVQSEITLIDDLATHIFQSGGKRLRPLLVLLSSHACCYQGKSHITLAAMIEFIHTATLLHDDVIDNSTLRRGRKTANDIWGSKASILVGDYLFTQYMQLLIDVGNSKITQLLTNTAHQMTCGEIKQLSNRRKAHLSMDEYFEIIRSKTSLLFAASAALGAIISDADSEVEQALYTYGLHLGNAFQLIDDALDYCADAETMGKNIGDDLADGKATLPLLHALRYATPSQQLKIQESLAQGTLIHLTDILEAIAATKAIEYTREIATQEIQHARQALQCLPPSTYRDALHELALYALQRDH